jgi:uncharacterized membrane protein YeiH
MFYLVIDILGTVAFAISGVLVAMEKKLDLFGVLIIAFVTAVGGGTLRLNTKTCGELKNG